MAKIVEPSVSLTAFNCPYCGVLTSQTWYGVSSRHLVKSKTPWIPAPDMAQRLREDNATPSEMKANLLAWADRLVAGEIVIESNQTTNYGSNIENLHVSVCAECQRVALWRMDSLLYPSDREGSPPNDDLNADIRHDIEEARSIVRFSPRGAASLLRLALQKLCIQLGEDGKNIDADIGSLVKKGLDPLVQQSLDIVRVVGNEAVHPGTLDLRDDRDTALHLIDLINEIAAQLITRKKRIETLYGRLPEAKRLAIAARDANVPPKP